MISSREALVQGGWKVNDVPVTDSVTGAAILSLSANDVGVVLENGKLYTLPGGKQEEGEALITTLERELNEELPPGWISLKALGPYVSEGCTYYVTHSRIPGIVYLPPQSPTIHPYVRRVLEHYQQVDHYDKKIHEIDIRELQRKKKVSSSTLKGYLKKPQRLRDVIEEFGYDWAKGDVAHECLIFGKEVWHVSYLRQVQGQERMINDRINQMKVVTLGKLIPLSLLKLVEHSGLLQEEILSLLQQMPVECVSGTYRWQKGQEG